MSTPAQRAERTLHIVKVSYRSRAGENAHASSPRLGTHVGERVLAADEPLLLLAVLLAREVVLVDAVQALGLVLVPARSA